MSLNLLALGCRAHHGWRTPLKITTRPAHRRDVSILSAIANDGLTAVAVARARTFDLSKNASVLAGTSAFCVGCTLLASEVRWACGARLLQPCRVAASSIGSGEANRVESTPCPLSSDSYATYCETSRSVVSMLCLSRIRSVNAKTVKRTARWCISDAIKSCTMPDLSFAGQDTAPLTA